MIGRLNHVAIAVPDLEAASAQYRDTLGAKVGAPQDEPDHGVTVVFIELPNTKIELLYPLGDGSPIQGFLDKNPSGGIHHMCYEVDDIIASRDKLKASLMGIMSGLVLFAVIWFMLLFITLPIRLETQGDVGEIVPGTQAGAPVDPQLKKRFKIVTAGAVVIWAILATIIITEAITVCDFDWFDTMAKECALREELDS